MQLKNKHILIVEDDALNRVVYQLTLGVQGALIKFDRWGRDALQNLEQRPTWDLIILDLMLPNGMTGYDVFTQIRSLDTYDDIPIVAVSASEPSIALPKARAFGFSGYISKPVDEARFASQIAKVINGEEIWYDGSLIRQ